MEAEFLSLGMDIIGLGVFNYDFRSLTTESPVIKVMPCQPPCACALPDTACLDCMCTPAGMHVMHVMHVTQHGVPSTAQADELMAFLRSMCCPSWCQQAELEQVW